MLDMNSALVLKANAFHITSQNKPELALTFEDGGAGVQMEDNAFGNVVGGKLWGKLEITVPDFPEGVFRLMLKAHFDVFSESTNTSTDTTKSCFDHTTILFSLVQI